MDIALNPGFLLHKIGAVMERTSDHVLFEKFGIGYSQFKILFVLEQSDSVLQKDIAHFLGQTEASISRQIKLLKSAGYIEITVGEDDKKKRIISLSKKGREADAQCLSALNIFYAPILSVLSAEEQHELALKLDRVHARLMDVCDMQSR